MITELCVFLKMDFLGQIQAWVSFQDFSQVFFPSLFRLYSCKEDPKIDMLKKFDQFITISLAVVLV